MDELFSDIEESLDENEETEELESDEVLEEDTQEEIEEDTQEEIEEDTQEDTQEEIEEEIKKFKVKINGEEKIIDEEELKKGYQLEQAARQKLEKASHQMKQLEDALKSGKDDPIQLLTWLGLDPDIFVKDYVKNKVEESKLTDEQKELRRLKKEKENWEKQQKELEEENNKKLYEEEANKIENDIIETLGDNHTNKTLVAQVANVMLTALNQNRTMTAKEAYSRIQNDTQTMLSHALNSDDVDKFISNLPKKAQMHLRKALVKTKVAKQKTSKTSSNDKSKSKKAKARSGFDELFKDANLL